MTFPATTQDATTRRAPSPGRAMPGSIISEQPTTLQRKSKTAELRWLGIHALGGVIMGLLIYLITSSLIYLVTGLHIYAR